MQTSNSDGGQQAVDTTETRLMLRTWTRMETVSS